MTNGKIKELRFPLLSDINAIRIFIPKTKNVFFLDGFVQRNNQKNKL